MQDYTGFLKQIHGDYFLVHHEPSQAIIIS